MPYPEPMRAASPRVLSIAGSDSGGGAGIQADLKAFARCGVHGMTAITAITAQNTVGVDAVHQRARRRSIVAQVRAVADDIGVDAVKIGMLGDRRDRRAPSREALDAARPGTPVVIDPVMVAESGAVLLDDEARGGARRRAAAARHRDHAEPARGARARGGAGDAGDDAEALARALHALGPATSSSPAATARRRPTCSSTASERRSDPRRAPPRRRRARLGLHALVGAGGAPGARRTPARGRPGARARSPARRSATACASSAQGAGPVDVFDLTAAARAHAARRPSADAPRGIIAT